MKVLNSLIKKNCYKATVTKIMWYGWLDIISRTEIKSPEISPHI